MPQWHHQGNTKRSIRWWQKVRLPKTLSLTFLTVLFSGAWEQNDNTQKLSEWNFPNRVYQRPSCHAAFSKSKPQEDIFTGGPNTKLLHERIKSFGGKAVLVYSAPGRCSGLQMLMLPSYTWNSVYLALADLSGCVLYVSHSGLGQRVQKSYHLDHCRVILHHLLAWLRIFHLGPLFKFQTYLFLGNALCSGRDKSEWEGGKVFVSATTPFSIFVWSSIGSQASHLAFDLHQWWVQFTTSAFLLSPGCPDHEWPLPYFPWGAAADPHRGLCTHLCECMVPSLGRPYGKLE